MIKSILSERKNKENFIGKTVFYSTIKGIQSGTLLRLTNKMGEIHGLGLRPMKNIYVNKDMADKRYVKELNNLFLSLNINLLTVNKNINQLLKEKPHLFI